MYILEYEKKGVDYWWNLVIEPDNIIVGRGIIHELRWNSFISLFTDSSSVMSVKLRERKMS